MTIPNYILTHFTIISSVYYTAGIGADIKTININKMNFLLQVSLLLSEGYNLQTCNFIKMFIIDASYFKII